MIKAAAQSKSSECCDHATSGYLITRLGSVEVVGLGQKFCSSSKCWRQVRGRGRHALSLPTKMYR